MRIKLYKSNISVPGISLRLAFKGVKDNFHLFSKRHSDLAKLFLAQNVGGPALIFDRFQEAGVTKIGHGIDAPVTKKILGLGTSCRFSEWVEKLPGINHYFLVSSNVLIF